ncbi:tRNA (cytidine(34)-2'-O)-methyltransferase [Bermanella sp. R86510]|uniref:tRNA (cytidine(34)-2'-O)-methyltransferase n=1 Tax=unclassified Bermanella TaxID=2627862 RepID=UPI0037C92933
MFHIALFEPNIAPNTGNIIRLCANNGCSLHLIEPLGFELDSKKLRRAGLDYHEFANVQVYPDYWAFKQAMGERRIFACTTKGSGHYHKAQYQADDVLLFGSETHGLAPEVMDSIDPEFRIRIPMLPGSRSLNLSNSVAIISLEAWRQNGFEGGV